MEIRLGEEHVLSSSYPDGRDYLYRCGRNKGERKTSYIWKDVWGSVSTHVSVHLSDFNPQTVPTADSAEGRHSLKKLHLHFYL